MGNGWTKWWDGLGERPVEDGTVIDVMLRCGHVSLNVRSGYHGEPGGIYRQWDDMWSHCGGPCDIVAYRPAEQVVEDMIRLSGVSTGAAKILYDAGYRKVNK